MTPVCLEAAGADRRDYQSTPVPENEPWRYPKTLEGRSNVRQGSASVKLVLAIVMLGQYYSQAFAQDTSWMSANQLLDLCLIPQPVECRGYIEGIQDGLDFYDSTLKKPRLICFPEKATARQLVDVVVSYLQSHPATRHHSAVDEVVGAFMSAFGTFPCAQ